MASVTLKDVSLTFDDVRVLHDINLTTDAGEFVVIVGPSGCGKSSLLRIIAGLQIPSSGAVYIGQEDVTDVHPSKRDIAMVFQNYALYPHMSVRDNMAFSLTVHHISDDELEQRINEAAEFLKITPLLDRYPGSLSGGQRQRVAIGRAIVRKPGVFLFDEPLSSLDAALRLDMRLKIAELQNQLRDTTIIYVTHDQVEAMTLADTIVVLSKDGGVEQTGEPSTLYTHPANRFVATFIGSPAMNVFPATLSSNGGAMRLCCPGFSTLEFELPAGNTQQDWPDGAVELGIRPEHIHLADPAQERITGTIRFIEKLGAYSLLHVDIGAGHWLIAKLPGITQAKRDTPAGFTFSNEHLHLFDNDGRTITSKILSESPSPDYS